jgi:diadenylate cyclase
VESLEPAFIAISEAAFALAESQRGALLVLVRRDSIEELITGGVPLGGEISREIIEAIFRKVSPVHDGATIIEKNRIARVAAVLPLTQREDIPSSYGTRHRAALGLAERCDAIVVVVSEERGVVTLVDGSKGRQIDRVQDLVKSLTALCGRSAVEIPSFRRNLGLKATAVGLAGLIWGISFGLTGTTGTTVRTIVVPVEFSNVPGGLRIARQSSTTLQVQLRGPGWLFESVSLSRITGRFDLRGLREGTQNVTLPAASLNLPPGVQVERVSPDSIVVVLTRK